MAGKKSIATKVTDAGAKPNEQGELPNKPNEPNFKLVISTRRIVFKCSNDRKPCPAHLKITNPTNELVCFKVRCTSAHMFRVQPNLGFIKPNSSEEFVIWFQNKMKIEKMKHKQYFAFYHTKGDARTPKEIWQNAKVEGVRRVPAYFERKVK